MSNKKIPKQNHMQILTAPHEALQVVTPEITQVTPELVKFIDELKVALDIAEKPKGVGLAATQVASDLRIFVARPDLESEIKTFINPKIIKHSQDKILGNTKEDKEARNEGCLSVPKLWGPVYRYSWLELEYQIIENNKLITKKEKLTDFFARVVQHELDHLNGILFIDHLLNSDLPIFIELEDGKLEEVKNKGLLKLKYAHE
jgi:peptide deformylase